VQNYIKLFFTVVTKGTLPLKSPHSQNEFVKYYAIFQLHGHQFLKQLNRERK